MMRSRSRMITICAVMTAVGLILGYLESFIVIPVRIPGIRLGLANTVTLITLFICGPVGAALVQLLRIVLSAILFGSPVSLVYSACGAVLSFAAMLFLKRFDFSIYGVSAGGAVCHNMGQIFAAVLMTGNAYVLYYLPVLCIVGIVTGIVTGALAAAVRQRLSYLINKGSNSESEGSI